MASLIYLVETPMMEAAGVVNPLHKQEPLTGEKHPPPPHCRSCSGHMQRLWPGAPLFYDSPPLVLKKLLQVESTRGGGEGGGGPISS